MTDPGDLAYWSTVIRSHKPPAIDPGWTNEPPRTEGWRARALCADVDPDMFYPSGDGRDAKKKKKAACDFCRHCPVIDDCLNHALTAGEHEGIWGGATEHERALMLRRKGRSRRKGTA